jgi:hypothetical protein
LELAGALPFSPERLSKSSPIIELKEKKLRFARALNRVNKPPRIDVETPDIGQTGRGEFGAFCIDAEFFVENEFGRFARDSIRNETVVDDFDAIFERPVDRLVSSPAA